MNAENFSEYLKNPSFLYQISYEELKTLTLQYPYSQNLRLLLLQKSRMENNGDYERNFRLAATYSVDRSYLYRFLKETAGFSKSEDTAIDEVLELRDLSELDLPQKEEVILSQETEPTSDDPPSTAEEAPDFSFDLTPLPSEEEDSSEPAEEMPELSVLTDSNPTEPVETPFISEELLIFTNKDVVKNVVAISAYLDGVTTSPKLEIEEYKPTSIPFRRIANLRRTTILGYAPSENVKPFFAPNHLIKTCIRVSVIAEKLTLQHATDQPQPEKLTRQRPPSAAIASPIEPHPQQQSREVEPVARYHFKSWRKVSKTSPLSDLLTKEEDTSTSPSRELGAEVFAAQSVRESRDVASETLAELLVTQGQLEKAIEMYRRLSLIFPEKSSYFAGKIEVLEIKQKNKRYL